MKQSKAIELLRKGVIQIENDLLPSLKEIKKLLKKAFPIDMDIVDNNEIYFSNCESNPKIWLAKYIPYERLKVIKLSSISKGKNKRKQLEKSFSELSKEVAEIKESIKGDWGSIIPSEKETPIKEEEVIEWNFPQLLQYIGESDIFIVATNGIHNQRQFEAIVVGSENEKRPVGQFVNNFAKKFFKPFKGTLTINQ